MGAATARGRMNSSTALAKPSSSLEVVTQVGWNWTVVSSRAACGAWGSVTYHSAPRYIHAYRPWAWIVSMTAGATSAGTPRRADPGARRMLCTWP